VLKKVTRINCIQEIIASILYYLLSLIKILSNWQTINPEVIEKIANKKKPLIILLWHNQIIGIPYCWNINKKLYNIVSDHPDSKLSAKVQKKYGFESIERSSKKPTTIFRKLIEIGKKNDCIFITPDGPHGPRYNVNSNIFNLAKKIKADIIFLSFKTNKKIFLKTWDRLRLPMPFSKGYYYWGKIISTEKYNEKEFNETIIKNLNNGKKIIDDYFSL
tara:strand:- start:2387 stop:3040 length:654 start_codon:yes stop_codon:yes gene_type:complete